MAIKFHNAAVSLVRRQRVRMYERFVVALVAHTMSIADDDDKLTEDEITSILYAEAARRYSHPRVVELLENILPGLAKAIWAWTLKRRGYEHVSN